MQLTLRAAVWGCWAPSSQRGLHPHGQLRGALPGWMWARVHRDRAQRIQQEILGKVQEKGDLGGMSRGPWGGSGAVWMEVPRRSCPTARPHPIPGAQAVSHWSLLTRRVPAGCGAGHVDLVMVIDGSKSVRPQNFELVKQFVNRIVDLLEVSPQGTRVGLVQYSSRVRTEFPLNKYHSADEIKEAVMKVEYMEKGTMTGLALKHMVEHSFSELEGARPLSHNIPRIGLVFTDGRSQDDISEWARRAKESGEG